MDIIKKIVQAVGVVIKALFGLVAGAFCGWLVGLFFHGCWWGFMGSFDFTSGLFLYTIPYAVVGALGGLAVALEDDEDRAANSNGHQR